ncbi:MAG: chorismate mutase [Clostridia bacterium]|nr:chorismate mutase [Clostridia bacterium]
MADIEKARREINECDREMARLFEKRMAAVYEVARYKQERGLPVEDLAREGEVIAKNSEYIENDVLREFYVNFLQTGMDISKNYQRRLISGQKIAYSGVPGAFADLAARKIFPDGSTVSCSDFKAAYDAVVSGDFDCALLPIENSYNGDVGQVMDLAYFGPLYINGVYQAEIVQNLLAVKGTTLDEVKRVISHPQALGQCAGYIRKHGFESIEAVNTAVAAKTVAEENDHSLAAIGSAEAARLCGLKILESHINESGKNTTRFAVFSRARKEESRNDNRFIMMFTVKNEPGCLGRAVSAIGENGFNLRALKSRPTKELSWSYYFYAEGEGCINSFEGRRMLNQLIPHCMDVKVVGSFEKEISI